MVTHSELSNELLVFVVCSQTLNVLLVITFYLLFLTVQTNQWLYIIDIEMNVSDMKTIQDFKSFVNSSSVPILLNNNTAITEIGITTGEFNYNLVQLDKSLELD